MTNKKDLTILSYLRQNARIKLTTMSRLTKMPVSTIFDKIKYYEGELIKGHICLLDFPKLGFNTRANVMLSIAKEDKEGIKEFLKKNQNVNSIYRINNGFDLLVEAVFRNISDLEEFLECLEDKFSIKAKEVHYIIDEIRREAFMSDPNTLSLLKLA